jgi:hypothetical protein
VLGRWIEGGGVHTTQRRYNKAKNNGEDIPRTRKGKRNYKIIIINYNYK